MNKIEEAFEVVNSLNIIDCNGMLTHGEQISMNEVRELVGSCSSPLDVYVIANKAIYTYLSRKNN